MKGITYKQKKVLRYIYDHVQIKGYPPTIRDIQMEMGFLSSSTAYGYVSKLKEMEYISLEKNMPRTLTVLPKGRNILMVN